jgi:hypothetical protein
MAVRPFGFRDADGHEDGTIRCIALSGNSDVLGIGDAVVLVGSTSGSGKIGRGEQVPAIQRAAATGALFGYVAAIQPGLAASADQDFNKLYRPASTAMYVDVVPFKPNHLYAIRSDGALAAEDVGENFLLATIVDADLTFGQSKMELSASSAATSQTGYQMTLMGLVDDGETAITDTNPVVKVYINTIQTNQPAFAGI